MTTTTKKKRIYIKDGKHKSYKNTVEYKLIKQKIAINPTSYLDAGNRDKIRQVHKEFLDKHNLDIIGREIVVDFHKMIDKIN